MFTTPSTPPGYHLTSQTINADGSVTLIYIPVVAPTPTPTPTPTGTTGTMAVGVQASWVYSGAFNASTTFPQPNNPQRLTIEKSLNLTVVRPWATIPVGAVVGGIGDNQEGIVKIIQQVVAEGKSVLPTITPQQSQPYVTPFPAAPAQVQAWLSQWLNAAEKATGKTSATLFHFGVEIGNELFNHQQFWTEKSTDIPAFVAACSAVLRARGVRAISSAWNGPPSSLPQLQAAYAPLLPYLDAIGLHPYVPAPGAMIQQVIQWSGKPVVVTEGSSGFGPLYDLLTYATQRRAARMEAAAAGCEVWIDFPSVVCPSQAPYGGEAGLVTMDGNPNEPFLSNF